MPSHSERVRRNYMTVNSIASSNAFEDQHVWVEVVVDKLSLWSQPSREQSYRLAAQRAYNQIMELYRVENQRSRK